MNRSQQIAILYDRIIQILSLGIGYSINMQSGIDRDAKKIPLRMKIRAIFPYK